MSTVSPVSAREGGIQQIMDMRAQIIERNQTLRAIHSPEGASVAGTGLLPAPTGNGAPAPGFADTLRSALEGVNSVQSRAETLSSAYQTGEVTDVAQVMLARQEAGIAFEATMQVRNKLLSAYQDIMRMGV